MPRSRPLPAHAGLRIGLALIVFSGAIGPRAEAGPDPKGPANRLARETSPYLLLHAHNPVDWYPWGPEAFARARAEGKPIFLSVGYSSCYWKHDWRLLGSFRGQPCAPSWVEVDACINPEQKRERRQCVRPWPSLPEHVG